MNNSFDYISNLQYCLKATEKQLQAFRSGERYVRITQERQKTIRAYERQIQELKRELAQARRETVSVRDMWFRVFEDLEAEQERELDRLRCLPKKMEERAIQAEAQRDTARDKVTRQRRQIYELETELEKERGKNLELTAQLNRDYENSSLPSSMTAKKKNISNSREKTWRRPGGQPGHTGHSHRKQAATETIRFMPPQEVPEDQDFKKTKKTIVRQVIGIRASVVVKEYHADVYHNSKTGERCHADFLAQATHDVNYDRSIKSIPVSAEHGLLRIDR